MNASAAVVDAVKTVAYPQTSRRYSSRPDPTASFTDPMTSRAAICHSYRLAITDHSCSGFSRRCWAALLASEGAAHGDGSRPDVRADLESGACEVDASIRSFRLAEQFASFSGARDGIAAIGKPPAVARAFG